MKTLSGTLCFTAVLFSQYSAALTAGSVVKSQGENLTMVCTTEDTDPIGLYLHLRRPEKHEVFYYDISSKTLVTSQEYDRRVTISGDPKKLTVTITSLRVNESGVYSCVFNFFDGKRVEKETNGALLFVKEKQLSQVPLDCDSPQAKRLKTEVMEDVQHQLLQEVSSLRKVQEELLNVERQRLELEKEKLKLEKKEM